MPFINVKVSEVLRPETIESVKSQLGQAISLISGKSEQWLMVDIEDGQNLFFKGTNDMPTAFTDVSIFGKATKNECENLTAAVCEILYKEIGVPADRSYVKFQFSDMWGYNSFMF